MSTRPTGQQSRQRGIRDLGTTLLQHIKGVFLGKSLHNDINVCGTALGVYLSSTVRRLPADQQWSRHMLKEMQGRPYRYIGAMKNLIGEIALREKGHQS